MNFYPHILCIHTTLDTDKQLPLCIVNYNVLQDKSLSLSFTMVKMCELNCTCRRWEMMGWMLWILNSLNSEREGKRKEEVRLVWERFVKEILTLRIFWKVQRIIDTSVCFSFIVLLTVSIKMILNIFCANKRDSYIQRTCFWLNMMIILTQDHSQHTHRNIIWCE